MPNILLLLTGGTICSRANASGRNFSDQATAAPQLIEQFQHSASPYAQTTRFHSLAPLDILSENMTPPHWDKLLDCLRQVRWSDYQGLVIAHGTDTLAYTACLLALALNHPQLPILLVSSDYNLQDARANGPANFRAAVELICRGLNAGVYAVYRNSDGQIWLHQAAHLRQCSNYSNDFFSPSARPLQIDAGAVFPPISLSTVPQGNHPPAAASTQLLHQLAPLSQLRVLNIQPYVGIDYAAYQLQGVQAVLHGLYHAQTACVQQLQAQDAYDSGSILYLLDRCQQQGIPLYIHPCHAQSYAYSSTELILEHGACPLYGLTPEMAYVKLLLSYALPLDAQQRQHFLNRNIAGEFIDSL